MQGFDDRRYTEDALIGQFGVIELQTKDPYSTPEELLIKELSLIDLHSKDGSALDAGCGCIEGKHTFNVETLSKEKAKGDFLSLKQRLYLVDGLAHEGQGFALTGDEKEFYDRLGNWARTMRKQIESSDFDVSQHRISCGHCENLRGEERKACLRECKHES